MSLGHALTKEMAAGNIFIAALRNLIYEIHMPLFFVIAGMLFYEWRLRYLEQHALVYLRKKSQDLSDTVCNVLCAGICCFPADGECRFSCICSDAGYHSLSIPHFMYTLITYAIPVDDHLWFVYVMFVICIAARFCIHHIAAWWMTVVAVLLYIISICIPLPEVVWKIFRYWLIFLLGIKMAEFATMRFMHWKIFAFSAVALALAMYAMNVNWAADKSWWRCIFLPIVQMSGSVILLGLSAKISAYKNRFEKIVKGIGKKSYQVYLIHQLFVVNGVIFAVGKAGLPVTVGIVLAVAAGISLPLLLDGFLFRRSAALRLILFGNH